MGPEDEGTPPAEDGGLTGHADRDLYTVQETRSYPSLAERRAIRKVPGAVKRTARSWKKFLMPDRADGQGIDLVRLLDENWYWRSSTASPSMAETGYSHRLEPLPSYHSSQRQRLGSRGASESANNAVTPFAERNREGGISGLDSKEMESAHHALLSRRSRSESIDNPATQADEEQRAHSYAQGSGFHPRQNGKRSGQLREPDPTAGDPLGTWAQRVFRFMPERKATAPTHIPGTPDVADLPPRQPRQQAAKPTPADSADGEDGDEEQALEAAWRWRFNRRWRTEQAKQLDPEFGLDGDDEDGWDTALGYLDACGPGFHLQIARTTSIENNLASSSIKSSTSDLGNILLDESQKDKGALKEQADMDATKSIVSVAKKARDLYKEQQRIERDVQTRWGNNKLSMSWAGQYLSAVKIDSYGNFPFILVKVSDRTTAHRLLVRGWNTATVASLMAAVANEVKQVCAEHKLAAVTVALLGSGAMEWSRERDHRVNISQGRVEKGCDPSIQTSQDIVRLAGALTRSSLPAPNRVMVQGEKLS